MIAKNAGQNPPAFLFAKIRSSERTKFMRYPGADHEISENLMESEFGILDSVNGLALGRKR
ncbi:MAG: hypothetical protein Udaeo2_26260 [Candidatus Udaeobacter sp.]|nr:MAG: hypothetical protein Udaeo2_26260 [Candidatus Udaeobacter sp.]